MSGAGEKFQHEPSVVLGEHIAGHQVLHPLEGTLEVRLPVASPRLDGTMEVKLPGQPSGPADMSGQTGPIALPFTSREEAGNMARQVFAQDVAGTVPLQNKTQDQVGEVDSARYKAWVAYFEGFTLSPQSTVKDIEILIDGVVLGLNKLESGIPVETGTAIARLRQIMEEYNTAYMAWLKQDAQQLGRVQQHYFSRPDTVQIVTELKAQGARVYGELAEIREKEERMEFLQGPKGQAVQASYTGLGKHYEIARDKLETAKGNYSANFRTKVETRLKKESMTAGQFSPEKIAEFIAHRTLPAIHKAVEDLPLTSEEKADIYERLPLGIVSQRQAANDGKITAYFGTEKTIPEQPGTDFRSNIAAALLKAELMAIASYEDEKEIKQLLWHYGHAVRNNGMQFTNDPNSSICLHYEDPGVWFGQETFFSPISARGDHFFADFLPLITNNKNAELIKKELHLGFDDKRSKSSTIVGGEIMTELRIKSSKNMDFLWLPVNYEDRERPNTVSIASVQAGIRALVELQADAVTLVAKKDGALSGQTAEIQRLGAAIDAQRLANFSAVTEANGRAADAERKLKEERRKRKTFLEGLAGMDGTFIAKAMKKQVGDELKAIVAQEEEEQRLAREKAANGGV